MIIRNHKCNGVPMFPIFLRQRAWRKKQELIPCQAAGNRKGSNAGKPLYALFDYTDRDPLDHQAKVTWIMEDEDAGLCSH